MMTCQARQQGSTFVIVLWVAFGLVGLTLYFANSMSLELRAADNRVCGMQAEQAIEAATRYVSSMYVASQTNGVVPDPSTYLCDAVPVGDAHFWLIGRETNALAPGLVSFGLVDEASRLNLNSATSNMLYYLPRMTEELAGAIIDWRDTNGGSGAFEMEYSLRNGYQNKGAPFETVDELRLVQGAYMDLLLGEDLNRNGALDPDELDENRNGLADPGILDYVTVYSREPNTYSNGTARVDIRSVNANGPLTQLLNSAFGSSRANQILTALGVLGAGGPGGPGRPPGGGGGTATFTSPLQLYRQSRMSVEEFGQIENALTTVQGSYIEGRVNVNTASITVLECLPGLNDNPGLAQTLVDYRRNNPSRLGSIAWVAEALGSGNSSALNALAARDCITTRSYQFTADVAALGPHGRGYRRTRFVFDTTDGTPRIVYRQDLSQAGWALGTDVRQAWLTSKDYR